MLHSGTGVGGLPAPGSASWDTTHNPGLRESHGDNCDCWKANAQVYSLPSNTTWPEKKTPSHSKEKPEPPLKETLKSVAAKGWQTGSRARLGRPLCQGRVGPGWFHPASGSTTRFSAPHILQP